MAKKRKKSAGKSKKKSAARKGRKPVAKRKARNKAAARKKTARKPASKGLGMMAAIGGAAAALVGTLGATEALRRRLGRRSPLDNE